MSKPVNSSSFECACGASNCRGVITSDDWRGAADMYGIAHVSDHIRALTLAEEQRSDLNSLDGLDSLSKIDGKLQRPRQPQPQGGHVQFSKGVLLGLRPPFYNLNLNLSKFSFKLGMKRPGAESGKIEETRQALENE